MVGCASGSSENTVCDNVQLSDSTIVVEQGLFVARMAATPITIDGCPSESIWETTNWYDMNHIWMGEEVEPSDYYGRFKLAWDQNYLYVLVEVTDDYLQETLADGEQNYWKGDYVEVFIDEDVSGGDHKLNHQAFAYHVSTEGHAIDLSEKDGMIYFDDHIEVSRSGDGTKYMWEMAIKVFDDSFYETSNENTSVALNEFKQLGFSIAYGDNDGNQSRENFMGSKKTHGVNNDEGYTNSSVFGKVALVR